MGNVADANIENLLGTAATFSDPDWGWDHLTLFSIALSEYSPDRPSYRFGQGETVPITHVRMRARMLFLQTLYRLRPESTRALVTPDALELIRTQHVALSKWGSHILELHEQGRLSAIDDHIDHKPARTEFNALADHILEWESEHGIHESSDDFWLMRAAHFTLVAAYRYLEYSGQLYNGPLVVRDAIRATVHEGKQDRHDSASQIRDMTERGVFTWTPPHKLIDVPIYLDDLKNPPYEHEDGYEEEDEGALGTFDPRTETVKKAEMRLLEALRPRLRRALESIVAEDREENGAVKPVAFRQLTAFEWLVQYQVLGESRAGIARKLAQERGKDDPAFYRSHVGREIRRIAELIGLNLRDAAE